MRVGLLIVVLVLASCAPSMQGANERGGIIRHATSDFNREQAFQLADQHCHKFGRSVRISSTDILGDTMTFDCVQ